MFISWDLAVVLVKNPPANAGDVRDMGLIPGSGRNPGKGHGNPLQYSCLENPMDRGAWQATVHRVAQCGTWLKQLSTQHVLISQGHIWSSLNFHFIDSGLDNCFQPFLLLLILMMRKVLTFYEGEEKEKIINAHIDSVVLWDIPGKHIYIYQSMCPFWEEKRE